MTLLESKEVEVKPCPDCLFTTCLCTEENKVFFWNVTATQLGKIEAKRWGGGSVVELASF